ncbi:MAG: lysylphosphatidylglycerol synthase transmembrane domain-containing protein [Actinomycetota bacterium]
MIKRAFLAIVLGVTLYLLLPRLGGLQRSIYELRHAHVWLMVLGAMIEAASLLAYILLYRKVLDAENRPVSFLAAGQGIMAAFLVSHVVPGGSAAGTVVNVKTMERQGVPARITGLSLTLTVLISDFAFVVIFLSGLFYSIVKGHVPRGFIVGVTITVPILLFVIGLALLLAFRPEPARRVVHAIATFLRKLAHKVDPDAMTERVTELAAEARTTLTGRSLMLVIVFALVNRLLDVFVLYLFFLAVGHHQHFGALVVAYSIANLAAVIPLTPGGLGVVEAALVAVSVGFGAPRATALVAVLGYRLVTFWLPLPVGLYAYVHSKVRVQGRKKE